MVIFGATGDLTARKLMPALYNLCAENILPERFFVAGVARRKFSCEDFRSLMREAVVKFSRTKKTETHIWQKLAKNLFYQDGYFEDEETYRKIIVLLSAFDKEIGACVTRFFYLATPPQNYSVILSHLEGSKLSEGCGQGSSKWTRIMIEKPFGRDLATAKKLEEQLSATFTERQIYRIDHYLAKETIQNILAFRFANNLFKPIWNKDYIDNIQITLAEANGAGNRGKFYDGVGALRDVAQNHLMAMLAYITMEEPKSFAASDTRAERVKVLQAIRCIEPGEVEQMVVRGQYGKALINDKKLAGYREEKDVDPASSTETYVAFKLFIDNDRWRNMPFYLRTGKRLKSSAVSIDIQFKNPKSQLFSAYRFPKEAHANTLRIRIQPKEGINFRFFAKSPGLSPELTPVNMDFSYEQSFKREMIDSYEKILIDSMTGDQTLFATNSGFRATWEFITKIMKGWKKMPVPKFPNYRAGSWGPNQADELIQRDGRHWLLH